MPATVERLEYDPNRSAFIALDQRHQDGELFDITGAAAASPSATIVGRTALRHQAGQLDAARCHSGRHDRAQH